MPAELMCKNVGLGARSLTETSVVICMSSFFLPISSVGLQRTPKDNFSTGV